MESHADRQASLEMSIQLPCIVRFEEETRTFVSACPPLNIISGADTEKESIDAIQSAIMLYLQTAVEDNRLNELLLAKGFVFTNNAREILNAEHFIAVRVSETAKSVSVKVPIGLLVARQLAEA